MENGFLKQGNFKVYYHRFGQGDQLLIALHGFADHGEIFKKLESSLSKHYIVYAIDLPFHGKTEWADDSYNQQDISGLFKTVLQRENKTRLDLMGFSMGGRIAQKMLFEWISKTDKVYLIAPDGLATRGLINANMVPLFFRRFLYQLVRQPNWLINTTSFLHRKKIVSKFLHRFIRYHLSDASHRDRLFFTWYSMNNFLFRISHLKKILSQHPIPVEMYFGTRDEVIPLKAGDLLSEGLSNVQVHHLDGHHQLINAKLDQLIAQQLE